MRSLGVADFPILEQGPEGTPVCQLNPPAGMLTSPGYDAAFRACLKLAVTGGRPAAPYQATALEALTQAEFMCAHGISGYLSPATLNGGIHDPDFPAPDTHTPQFPAAAKGCQVPGSCKVVVGRVAVQP